MNKQELFENVSNDLKTVQLKVGSEPRTTFVDKNEVLNLISRLDEVAPKAKVESSYQVVFSFSHRLPLTYLIEASSERHAISLALTAFNRNAFLDNEVIKQIYVAKER